MGLKNTSNLVFLSLSAGRFKLRVEEGTPGALKQTGSDGTVRYYQLFDTLTGYLDGVSVKYNDKFKVDVLNIDIRDDEDADKVYRISVNFNGSVARNLIAQLLSADVAEPVEIQTWAEELDDGKKRTKAIVRQHGKTLEWYLLSSRNEKAKSLPKERIFPAPVKTVVNGKEVWDFTGQLDMLRKYVDVLDKKIKGAIVQNSAEDDEVFDADVFEETEAPAANTASEEDDLPF